jgi:hypothetical protein
MMQQLGQSTTFYRITLGSDATLKDKLTAAGVTLPTRTKWVLFSLEDGSTGYYNHSDVASSSSTPPMLEVWMALSKEKAEAIHISGSGHVNVYIME